MDRPELAPGAEGALPPPPRARGGGGDAWVRLLSVESSSAAAPVKAHAEGLAFLESLGPVSIVLFCSSGSPARKSAVLSALVSAGDAAALAEPQRAGATAWCLTTPVAHNREGAVVVVECTGLLAGDASSTPRQLLVSLLLLASVVAYESPPAAAGPASVERWQALESLMQLASFAAPGASAAAVDAQAEQDGVLDVMPALVWTFARADGGAAVASATKELEEGLLRQDTGFSDETSRRNNARLLVSSVFRRREACAQLDVLKQRVVEAARPKLALGRVCTGPMLGAMIGAWATALVGGGKASILEASRLAVDELHARALGEGLAAHAAALERALPRGAMAAAALDGVLAAAAADAEKALADATKAVAPLPRGSGAAPAAPTAQLKEALRARAKERRATNAAAARRAAESQLETLHAALVQAADSAARIGAPAAGDDGDDDDAAAPPSRRAELWLQAYKGRLGTMLADFEKHAADPQEATEAMGRFWSAAAPEIVAGRSRVLLGALSSERASMVAEMAECIGATAKMEGELGGVLRKMRGAMQEHHAALGARMEAMETAKMDREAALDSAVGEVDAALRGHDRLEQRLKVKLDGAVSRACARVDDAQTLVHRAGAAAHEAVDRCAALESDLAETRLDALRVRCVTLGHEKANLGEHMELLEEHLERLKADLDQKQAEVAEVEHQWSQTKARLPALKHKHKDAEKLRAALADLAKKLKAHAKAQAKGAGLPRALLQHLDPMERQALEDL